MTLKIATYNLNNLFERAKILDLHSSGNTGFSAITKEVLTDVGKLNSLLSMESYTGSTGKKIVELLTKYFIKKPFEPENYFSINQLRERLYTLSKNKINLKATGREDWLGFVEFTKVRTNDTAVINTARVLDAVEADILCCVEVDNRPALVHFNNLMEAEFGKSFRNCMLIDGNDERGIDVGICSQYPITSMSSHVDDVYQFGDAGFIPVFDRDCPEFTIQLKKNRNIYVLCNHFKSKGYGGLADSAKRREQQAKRVVEILKKYDLKRDLVVVAGDLNDTPDSFPLKSLLNLPQLHDVLDWTGFSGERSTYHTGRQQIDYLLVSTPLFDTITDVQIERRGIYKRGNLSFAEVTSKTTQASDHACVWASFDGVF